MKSFDRTRFAGWLRDTVGADRPGRGRPRTARKFSPSLLEQMEGRVVPSTTITGVTPMPGVVPFVPGGHQDVLPPGEHTYDANDVQFAAVPNTTIITATFNAEKGKDYVFCVYASPSRNGDNLTAQTLLATKVVRADCDGELKICFDLKDCDKIPGHYDVQCEVFKLCKDQVDCDGNLTKDTLKDLQKLATGSTPDWVPDQFLGGQLFDVDFDQVPNGGSKK